MGSANQDYSNWARNFFAMGNQPMPAAPVAKPGFGAGLSNLLQNKMLLQFLSAAGTDLMRGTGGANLNAAVQQNISSQNYMKLLSAMLAGKMPGADAKITDKGLTLNFQRETPVGEPGPDPGQTGIPHFGAANPFQTSQPGFSASDLAGVPPELISQALQLKQSQDVIQQKSFTDIMDMLHRNRMADIAERGVAVDEAGIPIRQTAAETDRLNAIRQMADEFRESPIEVPGLGKVDLKTWNSLEPKTQAYSYYVFDQKTNKRAPLTYDAWTKQTDPLAIERYYERSKTDPAFKQFLFEYQRSGATQVNVPADVRALQTGGVEARVQLMDPAKRQSIIDKAIEDASDVRSQITLAVGKPEEIAQIKNIKAAGVIEDMIITGGGTIIDRKPNANGNMVWIVKWPPVSGETEGKTTTIVQRRY